MGQALTLRRLGLQDYQTTWQAMSQFTDERHVSTPDELWLVQHPPVFTQGQAGKAEHLLNPGDIPIVQSDRGGQVTYHGPGQLVIYPLINLRRRGLSVREMVTLLETLAIELLADYDVYAYAKADAPGVYVLHKAHFGKPGEPTNNLKQQAREAKIASLGLRVRKGCSFHGMSINVAMDLSPFSLINPCGYQGMAVTQVSDLPGLDGVSVEEIEQAVIRWIAKHLDCNPVAV